MTGPGSHGQDRAEPGIKPRQYHSRASGLNIPKPKITLRGHLISAPKFSGLLNGDSDSACRTVSLGKAHRENGCGVPQKLPCTVEWILLLSLGLGWHFGWHFFNSKDRRGVDAGGWEAKLRV